MDKTILVFGAGYVGFSLSVVMARVADVVVVDISDEIVDMINEGKSPINDQGIEEYLRLGLSTRRLRAEKYSENLVQLADFVVLALPTNFDETNKTFDTSALDEVIQTIANVDSEKPIIIKSTIPVGYTDRMRHKCNLTECAYSPEFLREGRAVYDNLHPSRIIIGSNSELMTEFVSILGDAAHQRNTKKIFTDNKTAEVTKLAANSYLATRVAFFNEIDSLALEIGLDTERLIDGICSDGRIGEGYNNPSFGYGGYCLPKDVKQFQSTYLQFGVKAPIIESINLSNEQRIEQIFRIVKASGVTKIGLYRAQMKQGSDNARESVNLALLEKLKTLEIVELRVYEPEIKLTPDVQQLILNDLPVFCEWAELILANRDAVELRPYRSKVLTRDIYNEN